MKRPKRISTLTRDTIHDATHKSSADINNIQALARCELTVVEREIEAHETALRTKRRQRAQINEQLDALSSVMAARPSAV